MKMLVALPHIHLVHLVLLVPDLLAQAVLVQTVVPHLALLLVPLQELLLHLFPQLFHPVEMLVAVDANAKLKITNALLVPLVQRVPLADLVPTDKMVLMVLLVLMLKMLPLQIILPKVASIALQDPKELQGQSEDLDLVD